MNEPKVYDVTPSSGGWRCHIDHRADAVAKFAPGLGDLDQPAHCGPSLARSRSIVSTRIRIQLRRRPRVEHLCSGRVGLFPARNVRRAWAIQPHTCRAHPVMCRPCRLSSNFMAPADDDRRVTSTLPYIIPAPPSSNYLLPPVSSPRAPAQLSDLDTSHPALYHSIGRR